MQAPVTADDSATFLSGSGAITVTLDDSIQLKQLGLINPTSLNVAGSGRIEFNDPVGSEAAIAVTRGGRIVTFGVETVVGDNEPFTASVVSGSDIVFSKGLGGTGQLIKSGAGRLILDAAGNAWAGSVTVNEGNVLLRGQGSLADNSAPIRVNPTGQLTISGNSVYGSRPLTLAGGVFSAAGPGSTEWNGPIEVTADSSLGAGAYLTINGVVSGTGGLRMTGPSARVQLKGDNTYLGATVITGNVEAYSPSALGSPSAGASVEAGGVLWLYSSLFEPITVRGGTVNVVSGASSVGGMVIETGTLSLLSNSQFATPVVLNQPAPTPPGTNPPIVLSGSGGTLLGGVYGKGDILTQGTLTVASNPLAFDGDLLVNGYLTLNTANTYTGGTRVAPNGFLTVNAEGALGTGADPVEVAGSAFGSGGTLILNASTGRDLLITGRGSVTVNNATPLPSKITFGAGGGILNGTGVFNGEIHLGASAATRIIRGGTINGSVIGNGDVGFGGDQPTPVNLNGDNVYFGITRVGGDVNANTETALGGDRRGSVVTRGVLRINAPTDEPLAVTGLGAIELNAVTPRLPNFANTLSSGTQYTGQRVVVNTPATFDEHVDLFQGELRANATTSIDSLTIREGGKVTTGDNGVLTVNSPEVILQSGSVAGRIEGASVIRKVTNIPAFLNAPLDFDGDIVIDSGVVRVENSSALGSTAGVVRVGARGATLETFGDVTLRDDVFLDNAQGVDRTGGLRIVGGNAFQRQMTLEGRLDLGTQGSIIGGSGWINANGPITGGGLTTVNGDLLLRIRGAGNTYTGPTDVRGGTVFVESQARLANTSAIILRQSGDSSLGRGTLQISNREGVLQDRIGDEVPVDMRGGALEGSGGINESLGALHFTEGISLIAADNTTSFDSARLSFSQVTRDLGAVAQVRNSATEVVEVRSPPATGGDFLPWMVVIERTSSSSANSGFGRVENGVIVPVVPNRVLSDSSAPGDDVSVVGGSLLTSDVEVRSLVHGRDQTLNLGGNRLTVASGGVIGNFGMINGGILTSGAPELFIHGGADIAADIVDNGGQSVAVVAAEASLRLRGANSFSGGLFANNTTVELFTEGALPNGSYIQIVGGEVDFRYTATQTKALGSVRITGDGYFRQRGTGRFSFDEVTLEQGGFLPGQIEGGGLIRKTTIGDATLDGGTEQGFTGQLIVEDGRLTASRIGNAQVTVRGGVLNLGNFSHPVELDGGSLAINQSLSGPITVSSASTLLTEPGSSLTRPELNGVLLGDAPLRLTSKAEFFDNRPLTLNVNSASPQYSGEVTIESQIISLNRTANLGSGPITIGHAGELRVTGSSGNNPPRVFGADIRLAGGLLNGNAGNGAVVFGGTVTVEGASFLGAGKFAGAVHLADRAIATTISEYATTFSGPIIVNGAAELRVGQNGILSSNPSDEYGAVISGVISPGAESSVLKITNLGFADIDFRASLQATNGKSLQVLIDGSPSPIDLSDASQTVSGNGIIGNSLSVSGGATISPGASVGTLTIDAAMTIGPGAVYDWEADGPSGASASTASDLLRVNGVLEFTADASDPWLLNLLPTAADALAMGGSWLIASAQQIVGFDPDAVVVGGLPINSRSIGSPKRNFVVEQRGESLYLIATIPEPASGGLVLILIAQLGATARRAIRS